MAIKIDSDVPLPENKIRNSRYPWAELKVGDSFEVPLRNELGFRATAYSAAKRLGIKVSVHKDGETIRVWRIS